MLLLGSLNSFGFDAVSVEFFPGGIRTAFSSSREVNRFMAFVAVLKNGLSSLSLSIAEESSSAFLDSKREGQSKV